MENWIEVKQRLPELVSDHDEIPGMRVSEPVEVLCRGKTRTARACAMEGEGVRWCDERGVWLAGVTHWNEPAFERVE